MDEINIKIDTDGTKEALYTIMDRLTHTSGLLTEDVGDNFSPKEIIAGVGAIRSFCDVIESICSNHIFALKMQGRCDRYNQRMKEQDK